MVGETSSEGFLDLFVLSCTVSWIMFILTMRSRQPLHYASMHVCCVFSPVYVDSSSDLGLVARRLMWGKFANCGQACIAPDYVLCSTDVQAGSTSVCCLSVGDHTVLILAIKLLKPPSVHGIVTVSSYCFLSSTACNRYWDCTIDEICHCFRSQFVKPRKYAVQCVIFSGWCLQL